MKRITMLAALSTVMLALVASAAFAATRYGTPYGDALYGTVYADKMYGYGGADLVYGYGGADVLHGGDEYGWGDKILAGGANDKVYGQSGDDALYGDSGDDLVLGGSGDDLVQGGYGHDTLNAGPGADRINAQDGQRDTIDLCGSGAYDVVYYDRGLDALLGCVYPQGTARESAGLSAAEATKATKTRVLSVKAPASIFGHTGKVLVSHDGEAACVPEREIKAHVGHGDEILNPAGCDGAKEGRR